MPFLIGVVHTRVRLILLLKCLQRCFFLVYKIYLLGTNLRLCCLAHVQGMCSREKTDHCCVKNLRTRVVIHVDHRPL